MSDTPRVDAWMSENGFPTWPYGIQLGDLAREIERELTRVRKILDDHSDINNAGGPNLAMSILQELDGDHP